MATQSSTLYATNVRHMLTDLTPEKDGKVVHNMEDDVIRGATATYAGRDHLPAAAAKGAGDRGQAEADQGAGATPRRSAAQRSRRLQAADQATRRRCSASGGALMLLVGLVAPASFMQHFIVFVLAVFVGFQVIWNVSHALHTPLMAITNAISSIIILGALLQIGSGSFAGDPACRASRSSWPGSTSSAASW